MAADRSDYKALSSESSSGSCGAVLGSGGGVSSGRGSAPVRMPNALILFMPRTASLRQIYQLVSSSWQDLSGMDSLVLFIVSSVTYEPITCREERFDGKLEHSGKRAK